MRVGYAIAIMVVLAIPFCITGIGVYKAVKSKFKDLDCVMWVAIGAAVASAATKIVHILSKYV